MIDFVWRFDITTSWMENGFFSHLSFYIGNEVSPVKRLHFKTKVIWWKPFRLYPGGVQYVVYALFLKLQELFQHRSMNGFVF